MSRQRVKTARSRPAPVPAPGRGLAAGLVFAGAAFVIALNLTPIYTNDFWLQLAVGDMIRRTGEIPRTILFCFTEAADYPFIAHEWLPSLLSSTLHRVVGYEGMVVFKCAMALLIWALVLLLAWRVGRNLQVSVAVASLVALAVNFRMQMRPEIFALALFLISLNLLLGFLRSGRLRWLLALVPVSLVWANSHGSFLIALGLPLLVLAGTWADDRLSGRLRDPESGRQRWRRIYLPLLVVALAMTLVSLLNPYGFRLLAHSFAYGSADYTREHLVEFGSTFDPRTREQPYFKVYLLFAAAVLASFLAARRRTSATAVLLALVFGYLSVDAIRFTAWFAVAGTWVLAHNLSGRAGPGGRGRALALAIALAAATVAVLALGNVRGKRVGFERASPLGERAIDFIKGEGIEGNVFNAFALGDQLVYHFYPRIKVAIDSRVDAYGETYYLDYRSMSGRSFALLGPPDRLVGFLERYGVRTIVTRPFDYNNWGKKGHVAALNGLGFRMVYLDDDTVILRR